MTLDEYTDVITGLFDLDEAHWQLVSHEAKTDIFFRPDGTIDAGSGYPELEEFFLTLKASGLGSPEMYAGDWASPVEAGRWAVMSIDGEVEAVVTTMEMVRLSILDGWGDREWPFLQTWLRPLILENVAASLRQDAISGDREYVHRRYQEVVDEVRDVCRSLPEKEVDELVRAEGTFFEGGTARHLVELVNRHVPGAFPRGDPAEDEIAVFWDALSTGEARLEDFPGFILGTTGRPVRVVDWWTLYWSWIERASARRSPRASRRR